MDVELALSGYIHTDFNGIAKLYNFYNSARLYKNQNITIDFSNLKFLDGNLCALFLSLLYKLTIDNGLTFSTNFELIKRKFDVLIRNGFIQLKDSVPDLQKSTLTVKRFDVKNLDEFVEYVQQDFKQHRGLNISPDKEDKILNSIIEVATNIEIHSNTTHPFFACGQFFPQEGVFKFSMVDLGDGFLPAINRSTNGGISSNIDAINWALQRGNTTKLNEPGGLGLADLHDYCNSSYSNMQIVTGNAFWSTEFAHLPYSHQNFSHQSFGTMINLLFSYN